MSVHRRFCCGIMPPEPSCSAFASEDEVLLFCHVCLTLSGTKSVPAPPHLRRLSTIIIIIIIAAAVIVIVLMRAGAFASGKGLVSAASEGGASCPTTVPMSFKFNKLMSL